MRNVWNSCGRRKARCGNCGKDRMCDRNDLCRECSGVVVDHESPVHLDPALWVIGPNGIRYYAGALR